MRKVQAEKGCVVLEERSDNPLLPLQTVHVWNLFSYGRLPA